MKTRYVSDELFHFVGHKHPTNDELNYGILKKVLKNRCVSHSPHENGWGSVSHIVDLEESLLSEKLIIPTITCYADIPKESLDIHIKKYGKFGLSFPKNLLIKYGARPVMYIPTRSDDWGSIHGKTLIKDIEAIYKKFNKNFDSKLDESQSRPLGIEPTNEHDLIHGIDSIFAKDFLAFIKPFDSELEQDNPDNFYMEREWRKHGNLKFEPDQVCQIYVASPKYALDVKSEFPHFAHLIEEL